MHNPTILALSSLVITFLHSAETDYNQTVAIGAYANAWGDQSTAIGNNVTAKGNSSIAIGADDWDTVAAKTVDGTGKTVKEVYEDYTDDVMVTGNYVHTTSGEAAVAIGTQSQATAELSTAFGTSTRALKASPLPHSVWVRKPLKATLWPSVRAVRLQLMQPKSTKLLSII